MKKNAYTLALLSLVAGVIVTFSFTRFGLGNTRFWHDENCIYLSQSSGVSCDAVQRGYPFTFLHSQNLVSKANGKVVVGSVPWIQVKTAVEDWLIWSVASAGGIGLLVYLLERAGISTGFKSKKSRR